MDHTTPHVTDIKKGARMMHARTRHGLTVLLLGALMASPAFGQDGKKGKKKKGEKEPEGPVTTMESEGADPAATETFEKGQFVPKGKTGKAREAEEEAAAERRERDRERRAPKVEPKPTKPINVFAQVGAGLGRGALNGRPNQTPPEDATRQGTAVGLVLGGSYEIDKGIDMGLRVPFSEASLKDPASGGNRVSQWAFGAPELFAEYRMSMSPRTIVPLRFGLGIPIGMGTNNPKSTDSAAEFRHDINALMDAGLGWEDPELYWVKRLPLILKAGVTWEPDKLYLHASMKWVFGFNVGDEGSTFANAVTYSVKAVSVRSVVKAGVSYEFMDAMHLAGGLDGFLVLNVADPLTYQNVGEGEPTALSPVQLVAEPRLHGDLGGFRPSVGVLVPLGGRLNDAGVIGVRVKAEIGFD